MGEEPTGLERLSALDSLLVSVETPNQHNHVVATLLLDASNRSEPVVFNDFRDRLDERVGLVPMMTRTLRAMPGGGAVWVDDRDFLLEEHLRHVTVRGGGIEALAAVAGQVATSPLAMDRPLWQAWFVDGLDDDRAGVIIKVHHGAVDGVSGIWALASFFDLDPHAAPQPPTPVVVRPEPSPAQIGEEVARDLTARPARVGDSLRRVAASALAAATARSEDTPLPFTAPRCSFNGTLSGERIVGLTRLDLESIKAVRRAHDVTVNDVLLAAVTGALRSYLTAADELPDRSLVAAVPVSEREPEHGLYGNRFSAMFCALPVHVDEPLERLRLAARSATAAKSLHERLDTGLAGHIATLFPGSVAGTIMRVASRVRAADVLPPLANVIVSNIRGPQFPLYASGARLESMFPLGPLIDGVGLGITVVTYIDEVDLGLVACPHLVPDVDPLLDAVHLEVEALAKTI